MLHTRQQHMAEQLADKLMTALLTSVPKPKVQICIFFFFPSRRNELIILETDIQK